MMCSLKAVSGSNPPSANFFRLLCSVHLPQKVRRIFGLKMQKTGPGTVSTTIPKPVFSDFTVFRAISAPKTRKLPDLSGRQIRQSVWWGRVDSNHRRHCQQIYSLSPLATREHPHMHFTHQGKVGAGRRIRTPDLLITNQLLYRLSYTSAIPATAIIAKQQPFVNKNLRPAPIFFIQATVPALSSYFS